MFRLDVHGGRENLRHDHDPDHVEDDRSLTDSRGDTELLTEAERN